jgi:predicted phosphodiesterase
MKNKPDLLICSDLHLREDIPICRSDGDLFLVAQWNKLDFISNLQQKYNCPVICGGDTFHAWKASPWLLSQTMIHLPNKFMVVMGQHDLQNHSLEYRFKGGIHTLAVARQLEILDGVHFGEEPDESKVLVINGKKILVWHHLVWKNELPFPGCKEPKAISVLKKYPWANLVICGDNHQTFVEEYQGRYLINPGSMTRQKSDQIDHKPCVFLWSAKSNELEQVFLPIEKNVITREHIEKDEARDERIQAFIEKLTDDSITDVNFQDNLKQFLSQNPLKKSVVNYIYKALERNL